MIEVIKKVVNAHERGSFMKYGLDTLIRIDEDVQVLSCTHCAFKDTDKFVQFLGCPFNWGDTFGNNESMVK